MTNTLNKQKSVLLKDTVYQRRNVSNNLLYNFSLLQSSVVDSDVFGPAGSGSVIILKRSVSLYHKAKRVIKNLDFYYFVQGFGSVFIVYGSGSGSRGSGWRPIRIRIRIRIRIQSGSRALMTKN
jgi:hypothetical protein